MEYYGKILCISYHDLTGGDNPVMSVPNYKKLSANGNINVVRQGKGLGNYALVEIATLPTRFRERIREKYGDLEAEILKNWFGTHFHVDAKAREFYTKFRFENGESLPPERIQEYTVNASVIEAVLAVMADRVLMRKAMKGGPVNWGEMCGAISYYQSEFGHTLPLSANRFKKRVHDFKAHGYESLISGKFLNQNRRKVTYGIERLLLAIDAQPEQPFNTTVWEQYNQFLQGGLELFDPDTGEVLNPADFTDKDGNPIVLSPTTVAAYLNKPANKALRAKLHMSQWDFNNSYRPYHLRHAGEYSLSKVSLDDRDLPRPMKDGVRVKAYYAYDVVSGAVVGYAYNRLKTAELFLDCMRNMFQTLERGGMYIPAELEVEHHLVSDFADGLMQAGVVFPLIRWCNPGNSREKRAEHFNRQKKYGVEKLTQVGIGRWWARLEANRPKEEKVYDEKNNTWKVKAYTFDELVADDIRAIGEYNNQLHPNQKRYPGMTRWDVLVAKVNPTLRPYDSRTLARYIGESVETSIRRNSTVRVAHADWWISGPEVLEELEPNNRKVTAYYLQDEDGKPTDVYLFQGDRYIDKVRPVNTYNRVMAEQTDEDVANYIEQQKYVSHFNKYLRDNAITKIGKADVQPQAYADEADAECYTLPPVPIQDEPEDYEWKPDMDNTSRALEDL